MMKKGMRREGDGRMTVINRVITRKSRQVSMISLIILSFVLALHQSCTIDKKRR